MRLIDADSLKEDLTRFYDGEVTARQLIDEQPTVEERKKGYWYTIERGEHGYSAGSFRCSVCGEPNRSYNPKPNFCGNCGADMRKERKG